jgi:hypothetical protein
MTIKRLCCTRLQMKLWHGQETKWHSLEKVSAFSRVEWKEPRLWSPTDLGWNPAFVFMTLGNSLHTPELQVLYQYDAV